MFDPSRWYSLSIWCSKLKLGKLIFLAHSLFPVLLSNLHLHLCPGMDAVPSPVDLCVLPWLFRSKKTPLLIAAGMIISKCNCSIHSCGQFPQTSYCFLFLLGSKPKFLTQTPQRIGFSHPVPLPSLEWLLLTLKPRPGNCLSLECSFVAATPPSSHLCLIYQF